jgi:hypothetical protein
MGFRGRLGRLTSQVGPCTRKRQRHRGHHRRGRRRRAGEGLAGLCPGSPAHHPGRWQGCGPAGPGPGCSCRGCAAVLPPAGGCARFGRWRRRAGSCGRWRGCRPARRQGRCSRCRRTSLAGDDRVRQSKRVMGGDASSARLGDVARHGDVDHPGHLGGPAHSRGGSRSMPSPSTSTAGRGWRPLGTRRCGHSRSSPTGA